MKKSTLVILLLALCVVIAVVPLMTNHESEFGGADGAAEEAISTVDPDYEPWAESLFELPGGETESLLFCVQTAIGALLLGGGFGYYVGRYHKEKDAADKPV